MPTLKALDILTAGPQVLRQDPKEKKSKSKKSKKVENQLIVMDGLVRREVSFPLVPEALHGNTTVLTRKNVVDVYAYVVGGRDVLRTWESKRSPVVILLPNEKGWKSKDMRIIADEISFNNQVIVLIPDIHIEKQPDLVPVLNDGTTKASKAKRAILTDELLEKIFAVMKYAAVQYDSLAISLSGVGKWPTGASEP